MSLKRQDFTDILTFTRNSEKTYFGKEPDGFGGFNYPLKTAAVNEPAFDHDPDTGEALGISIHEQRTRLNTISAAPTTAEDVTVSAVEYTISFYGTGSIDLTGAHVETIAGVGSFPARTEVTFTPSAGTLTITPSGDIKYLQLEEGSFATPVILGEGTQVTRQADLCSIDNIDQSDWWNSNEGTFVVELQKLRLSIQPFALTDGTPSERIFLRTSDSEDTISMNAFGVSILNSSVSQPYSDGRVKIACRYLSESGVAISINGSSVSSTSAGVPTGINTLSIGYNGLGLQQVNGQIPIIKYKPTAVSDAELQELSKL